MAIRLIMHTFRMIFGNLGQALKVSVGPYLLLLIGGLVIVAIARPSINSVVGFTIFHQFLVVVSIVLVVFIAAWVAVSWHRFVLLEEYTSVIPAIKNRPIWPYVGKVFLMSLILLLIGGLFLFCFSLLSLVPLAASSGEVIVIYNAIFSIVTLVLYAVLVVVALRMGVALVATALGKSMNFRDAVEVTGKISGVIWGVSFILIFINAIAGVAIEFAFELQWTVGYFLEIVLRWITTMLGISILTTIYGHVVEGRPLAD